MNEPPILKGMKMKRIYISCLLIGWTLLSIGDGLLAQQTPTSYNMLFRPRIWNPASRGAEEFHKVVLSHQQRHVAIPGWRSTSQFLDFNSAPEGKKGAFGWGVMVANDLEHTESRFAFSGAAAVSLIKQKNVRFSLGISAGLVNWSSNYDSIRVFDRTDELLDNPSTFVEVDAGMGAEFAFKTKGWDIELGAAASQIPQNLATSDTNILAFTVYPQLAAGGLVLFEPIHNLKIGPSFFYKNVFLVDPAQVKLPGGLLDVGLKAELDRQGMWFGGAYRFNRSAITAAFGLQVYLSDSAKHPRKVATIVDINAGFSYPMKQFDAFGPAMEVGMSIYFGRELKYRRMIDTAVYVNGSFWETDGNVSHHLQNKFLGNSPPGTRGGTNVTPKNVTLTYEFPDPSLQYIGTTPDISGDTVFALGAEWVGVDGLLEGVANEVIREALHPDSTNVVNPEVLIALERIEFLEFSALLKANETEAFDTAEAVVYEGELGVTDEEEGILSLPVVYNGADTIIDIPTNRYISNLELACLKLHAMSRKVVHELNVKYGDKFLFVMEGDDYDLVALKLKEGGKVTIKKPRILPNHPHQDVFQINQVRIKFTKFKADQTEEFGPQDAESQINFSDDEKRRKRKVKLSGSFRDKR
jgi:hypothetical protein